GDQEVLHRGVDRAAAHDRWAGEVRVGDRQQPGVEAEDGDDRSEVEVPGEVVRGGEHALVLRPRLGRERLEYLTMALRVRLPGADVELLEPLLRGWIGDRDDPPRLPVAPGRRPRRRLDHAAQHRIGDRVGFEAPYRAERAHRLVDSDL